MAYDFPNSPTAGQIFAPALGPSWIYEDGVWKMLTTGPSVSVATGTPVSVNYNGKVFLIQIEEEP